MKRERIIFELIQDLLIGFGLPEMKLAQGIVRPLNILLPWLQKIFVVAIIFIINVTFPISAKLSGME